MDVMQSLVEGLSYKYKNDVMILQKAYTQLKDFAEQESRIIGHVEAKFKDAMKAD